MEVLKFASEIVMTPTKEDGEAETMTYLYTSRSKFSKDNDSAILAWAKYIEWSRLTHLTELVSLDRSLNEVLVEPGRNNEDDWKEIVTENYNETRFFRTFDYVLRRTIDKKPFNLLMVVIEPESDCSLIQSDEYDFLGYDLLDHLYANSALTNCGGFDESFQGSDLNHAGLIDDYEKAYAIHRRLLENNPMEDNAVTNVIEIGAIEQ